ncbi:hypothetical protein B0I08_104292 [Glaciihabitans tibetensis]|uniref:Uncharacterized protein n=1 Tax=Glaciihabitans tibetensis TaxID=1266600 RepID=A0A2T0VEI7_9MICO|nr:hypothetical protein B0I08_104292 [Glaciihabitans tibetensis]
MFNWGASRKLSTLRMFDCITAVPIAPGDAPMMPLGLRAKELVPQGLDPQPIAFLSAPGIALLYTGEMKRMPSDAAIASLRATPSGGYSASKSESYSGRSLMGISVYAFPTTARCRLILRRI